jgi:hypothetical protein
MLGNCTALTGLVAALNIASQGVALVVSHIFLAAGGAWGAWVGASGVVASSQDR